MTQDLYSIDSTKIFLHPARVAQWLDAGDDVSALIKVYPIYCEISPVGNCNHRCAFCSVDYLGYVRRKLDSAKLLTAISNMAQNGVKSIMYAGEGEPLLHPDIGDIIVGTKARGIDVAITTNATALTEKLVEQALSSVTWLKASINAGTPEAYAEVHQTKAKDFFRVIENLSDAVKWRNRNGWKTTLGAQIVLIQQNIHTAAELASLCREIGLDYLVVKPYSQNPNSTGTLDKGFDKFDYRDESVKDLAAQLAEFNTPTFQVVYRERTMANLAEPERGYQVCHATPFQWCYIQSDATVSACSAHLLKPDFELGNLNSQSFSEIWEGEKRRALIERMRTFDISVCRKNCRMNEVNKYLDRLKSPDAHDAFI